MKYRIIEFCVVDKKSEIRKSHGHISFIHTERDYYGLRYSMYKLRTTANGRYIRGYFTSWFYDHAREYEV